MLDYSICPDEFDRSKALLDYFDDKFPKVFKSLNQEASNIIDILLFDGVGASASNENRYIKYGIRNSRKDFGCLIHEATHLAQNYKSDTYRNNQFIAEGMADYLRAKLSDDGWDNPDDQFPCSHRQVQLDCSKCGAGFLMWLEAKLAVKDFVARLNDSLRNDLSFDEFLFGICKDASNLC